MMIDPTVEQAEQCAIVQQEIVEAINRLIDEGIDARVVMAGLGAASAAAVLHLYGAGEVTAWFAKQSVMTASLSKPLN
ncbi:MULTISPECIES: hypothetical protein [unclassified Sphingomonas]|uniref:hypothetical protein n=1 Tax=Sphingomonas sp. PvP015 TaxID=3156388 RepID=UPI00339427F5